MPERYSDLAFVRGGGEMGARMRALDWATTPIGPPDTWPQSLRSTVSMLLPSKAQIVLFWGPEFTVLYNDAYRPVFGAKHPAALGLPGREAWSEIDAEATRTLKTLLAARRLVDFNGPLGWSATCVPTGRTEKLSPPLQDGAVSRLRTSLPLMEVRVPFEVSREELDAISRGARDADLDPVRNAARAAATAEDRAIFRGYAPAGIAGIFDPASDAKLPNKSEDFGQTLGVWGWKKSRYVELPLFGPRTLRDSFGMVGDAPLSPLRQVEADATRIPLQGVQLVDVRAQLLATDSFREGAEDDYTLVRDAWMQRRDYQIFGERMNGDESESLPDYLRDDTNPQVPVDAMPVMPTDGT